MFPRRGGGFRAAVVVALAAVLAGAGCGGGTPERAPGADSGDDQRFPVTVEHSLGSTVIESKPERVVTLGVSDADVALALGVTPVGIHSLYEFDSGVGPWAQDELRELGGEPPAVWKGRELNYEAIATARPDLILNVSASGDQAEHDQLSRIAPTVALPKGAPAYAAPWRDTTTLVAAALGLPEEGERLVRETDGYLAGLAQANPQFKDRTLTYLDVYNSELYAGGRDSTVVATMTQLGFVPVPYIRDLQPSESQNAISAELLSQVDADVVIAYGFGAPQQQVLDANPALRNLDAARSGHLHFLPDLSLSAPSVLSIPHGVDALLPFLQQATAGA